MVAAAYTLSHEFYYIYDAKNKSSFLYLKKNSNSIDMTIFFLFSYFPFVIFSFAPKALRSSAFRKRPESTKYLHNNTTQHFNSPKETHR